MTLREFLILTENYKNIFKKDDMQKYLDQVYDVLDLSYKSIGGLVTSKEELVDESDMWKLHIKDGKVQVVYVYKDKGGRKLVAVGTDGSVEAKRILIKDIEHEIKRSYVEASGALEKVFKNIIGDRKEYEVPASDLTKHTGKKALEIDPDGHHYTRKIGDKPYRKAMYGTPGLRIIKKNP